MTNRKETPITTAIHLIGKYLSMHGQPKVSSEGYLKVDRYNYMHGLFTNPSNRAPPIHN